MTLSQVIEQKKTHCGGCRDNHYNHSSPDGVPNSNTGCCWSLDGAKLVWRWKINMWTPMDRRDRFVKVRVYNCFHGEGSQRDIYMKRLPKHLGGDWADKDEEKAGVEA